MEGARVLATVTVQNTGETYATHVATPDHRLLVDEPEGFGGKNLGPSPGDLLCSSLATCTAITLRMYANRKLWKVTDITITVSLVKGSDTPSGNNTFRCEVKTSGELDEAQQKRLLEIAKACPIHRLLTKPSEIVTVAITE